MTQKRELTDDNFFIIKMLSIIFLVFMLSGCLTGNKQATISSDVLIIGKVEPVTIDKAGFTMPARIDTGAQTSSLNATEIEMFERDGKRWVRFTTTDPKSGKSAEIESKLSRIVKIKRHGGESIERPVVKLKAILGQVVELREFTLTDRSTFTYPILIGRNFLDGQFIVDVSRKNSTSPMNKGKKHVK